MNKILIGLLATTAATGTSLGVVAAHQTPTIRANTFAGPVAVGGLSPEEAAKRIRAWWETERIKKLPVVLSEKNAVLPSMTPGALGIGIDDAAIVAKLPRAGMAESLTGAPDRVEIPLEYKPNGVDLQSVAALVKAKLGKPHPAKVRWTPAGVETTPESALMQLDAKGVPQATIAALQGDRTVDLPLIEAPKHVPDAALAEMTDLVSQYTTSFPASNRPRCSNIKLASSKLNGVIVMPGERLSFNGTVGERTLRGGFKLAGVYKQGKHDVGVGGGICQVSTTLYNASLFANLRIRQRSNHSLPVAYVPLGRDATVDYGSLDLVVENNTKAPIGVVDTYQPGRLTFRILGKKEPGLSVKVVQEGSRSWDMPVETHLDRSLRPGARRIVEPGSRGHAVRTYRLVYRNGHLAQRQALGSSTYGGQTQIVAVGPAAPKPKALPTVPTTMVAPPVSPPLGGIGLRVCDENFLTKVGALRQTCPKMVDAGKLPTMARSVPLCEGCAFVRYVGSCGDGDASPPK